VSATWREPVAVLLFFAALTILVTWPQVWHLSTRVADLGDPLLNSWTLAWVAHSLPAHPLQLFDANIFYPERHTLAYSESLIVPALMVAPVRWLGGDPILAHNVLLLAGYALSGAAMYLLVRSLTDHRGAALVAGSLFTVCPYRLEVYPKVQLQLVFWTPLALWAVHRLRSRATIRTGLAAGGFAALQMYSCVYYGVFAIVPLSAVAIAVVVSAAPADRARIARALVAGALVALAVCAPLAAPYRAAARTVGERSSDEVRDWSARPADFLRAHPANALYGDPANPGEGERRLFPGVVAPALALAALAPPWSSVAVAYAATGAASFDLALGVNGAGYGALFSRVPLLHALRVPARFAMLFNLALAVLAGLGVARLCRRRSAGAQIAIVAVAIALAVVESRPRALELREIDDHAPPIYHWLASQPPGVVCEYPVGSIEGRLVPQDPTYMYYSTRHWRPLVNGYSGFQPPSYDELVHALGGFPDDASIAYLRERGVRYLLVHGAFNAYIHRSFEEDVRLLKGRTDVEWAGRFPWRGGGYSDAFRIR